jgi:uroporphyrinogen-III synthase
VQAVVLSSPSIARRFHSVCGAPPRGVGIVAIGEVTAREAATLGMVGAITAGAPTPAGVADALAATIKATGEAP